MYKFKIVKKSNKTSKHLDTNSLDVDYMSEGKLDLDDLQNSNFPPEIKNLSKEETDRIKNGEVVKISFTTTTTVELNQSV